MINWRADESSHLIEMKGVRFVGCARQLQNEEATILNAIAKIVKHKASLLVLSGVPVLFTLDQKFLYCWAAR